MSGGSTYSNIVYIGERRDNMEGLVIINSGAP